VPKFIPKEFIAHVIKLGFTAKDAARLYDSKDDWLGMSKGGRILCAQRNCKFSIPMSSDALFEHCRTVHAWRDYPCTHDNCEFVAYSKTSFKSHQAQFHSPYRTHNGNYLSCPRPRCKAAFKDNWSLSQHERVHSNDVYKCIFCPYVNALQQHMIEHQRVHFNTRDYVCDFCQKAFTNGCKLKEHVRLLHETDEAKTQCPLCDRVALRKRILCHLKDKHKVTGMKWDAKQMQYFVPQQIIPKDCTNC